MPIRPVTLAFTLHDKARILMKFAARTLLTGLAVFALAQSGLAQGTFGFRKAITINQNPARPVLNDFPLLVSINGDPDLVTKVQSANGDDIMFKASDGVTNLDFEIEWFNQGSGTLEAWVRIPALQPGANTIYMDYGNAQITSSPATPCRVWKDYLGVWHLSESANGTLGEYKDSGPFGLHGQGGEGDPLFVPTRVNGKAGFAQHFDNADTKYDVVDCGDDALFDVTGNEITVQAWVQHNVVPPQSHKYGILANKGWSDGYSLWVEGETSQCPTAALCVGFNLQGQSHQLKTDAVVSAGSWHHVVGTYDGATMRVYIDGVADINTLAKTNNLAPSIAEPDFFIGHGDQPKDRIWSGEWEGELDEVRISRIARSADWIATEFDNQDSTCEPASAFCSVGAEVPGSYAANTLTTNYRSIGTAAGNLAPAGNATATASSPTIDFDVSLPATIGRGDLLTLDPGGSPETLFILSRDSATRVTVQSDAASSRVVPFTITRAYASLAAWEADIGSGGRGGDLVAGNRREVGVVYKDGPLAGVTIGGSITDCAHDLVLTSPRFQKHIGIAGTGAVIDNGASAAPAVRILDDYVTVEWLEITGGTGSAADGIELANGINAANRSALQYNIIHDTGGDGIRVSDPDVVTDIFNNVIYETNYGIDLTVDFTNESRVNVFSNTVYGSNASAGTPSGIRTAVRQTSVRADLRDNIAHSNANGDYGLVAPFERAYFCNPGCTQIADGGTVPSVNEYLADSTNNFTFNFVAGTDFLYLGSTRMFRGLMFTPATQGTGSPNLQWEYWNGAAWADLEANGFANYMGDFKWPGGAYWPNDPAGWATTTVSGSPNLYYVRASLASGSYTVSPQEGLLFPIEVNVGSRNNLASDFTATTHSPFATGNTGIDSVPLASMNFVSTAAGSEDLHITAGSAAEDTGAGLGNYFFGDIDGALRTTPWDIGADDISATTAVDLVSFDATGFDGEVLLQWETGSELDNLGFHLYRANDEEGPYALLTSSPIPGLGSSPEGARYRFVDRDVANGRRYFYRLEDIETTGKRQMHGPVSASPAHGRGSCCESETANASAAITVGDPEDIDFRVLRDGGDELLVELTTGGFYAEPRGDGSVEIAVPGFETFDALPVRRAWLDAVAGRNVRLASVEAFDVLVLDGLFPPGVMAHELFADARGTVRLLRARRRGPRIDGTGPSGWARLLDVGYQGDVKKALVELSPIRWDRARGELVLARRIVVKLAFRGRDPDDGVRAGRPRRRHVSTGSPGEIVARLTARESGLYAVRFEDVFSTRRRGGAAPGSFRLSRLGEAVPFHVEPTGADFSPGTTLYFVSEGGTVNPYGREATYELAIAAEGRRMAVRDGTPRGAELAVYRHYELREENRYYQPALLAAPDRWLWDLVLSGTSKTFTVRTVDYVAESETALTVWLSGTSDLSPGVDHHLRFYLNGSFVHEVFLEGKEPWRGDIEVPPGIVREGDNQLRLDNVGDTGTRYSMVMLDKFALDYPRRGQALGGLLEGTWSRSGTAVVSGMSSGYVVDVTEEPVWLAGATVDNDALRFRVEEGRRLLAVSPQSVRAPRVHGPPRSHLRSGRYGADYLVVAPRAFLPSLEPLLERRRGQGLAVEAVSVEDIFSEFGFGEARPEAIREFLAFAYHHWSPPSLRYVLLVGDATYDYEDYLGTGVLNRVPGLPIKTSYLWTISDPAYASVNGEDLLPDVALGRLPAASVEEVEAMVEKILAFEQADRAEDPPIVLVVDDPDLAGNFPADAAELSRTVLEGRNVTQIEIGRLGPATREAIVEAFDTDPQLVSYLGHGGIHLWADENVFNRGDVRSLGPRALPPLLLTMNCLNGYFHFPYFDSLAEALVEAEGKGAIAAFSPSGLSLNFAAHRYHRALLQEILSGSHARLGDAVLAAQTIYASEGVMPELLSIYHLLGDPGLRLRTREDDRARD